MRLLFRIRIDRVAVVAIYDALLFLMVAILISEGMFLYSTTAISEGGELSDSMYQRICDNQLTMVENLAVNQIDPRNQTILENWSVPIPLITWSNGTNTSIIPLTEIMDTPVESVRWLLESYCILTWRNGPGQEIYDGQWNTSTILPLVDAFFEDNQLNGTEHAWMFRYKGQVMLFGSSSVENVEDLPNDRWTSSRDYTVVTQGGASQLIKYDAELSYFLWFP